MNRKMIAIGALILTICFLIMGVISNSTAKKQQGLSITVGGINDGEFIGSSSGRIGANYEKYEVFHNEAIFFYTLAGITGIVCVVAIVTNKKNNK